MNKRRGFLSILGLELPYTKKMANYGVVMHNPAVVFPGSSSVSSANESQITTHGWGSLRENQAMASNPAVMVCEATRYLKLGLGRCLYEQE